MSATNRILIVDDHVLFRSVLRDFLSQEPDLRIVGEAGSVGEALRAISSLTPHLVLTDLAMPDARGVEAVTEIRRHHPDMKILVISSYAENEYRYRCRTAGAAGYVVKDDIHDELTIGIRIVLGGNIYAGRRAAARPVQRDAAAHAYGADQRSG